MTLQMKNRQVNQISVPALDCLRQRVLVVSKAVEQRHLRKMFQEAWDE